MGGKEAYRYPFWPLTKARSFVIVVFLPLCYPGLIGSEMCGCEDPHLRKVLAQERLFAKVVPLFSFLFPWCCFGQTRRGGPEQRGQREEREESSRSKEQAMAMSLSSRSRQPLSSVSGHLACGSESLKLYREQERDKRAWEAGTNKVKAGTVSCCCK